MDETIGHYRSKACVRRAAAGVLLACGLTVSASAQTTVGQLLTRPADWHFDQPSGVRTLTLPATASQPERQEIRCISYATFMVRAVHSGDDIGTSSLSVIPATVSNPPPCKVEESQRERTLPDNGGMEFAGAIGRFLLLVWPDGANGGAPFSVFDAVAARKLYTDTMRLDNPAGLTLSEGGATLTLRYERVLTAPCSLAGADPGCWARFVRAAKLPLEMSRRAPPVSTCAAAYAGKDGAGGGDLTNPSVLSYEVTVAVSVDGNTKVLSRGGFACWPSQ
jgi:hypothetical protein